VKRKPRWVSKAATLAIHEALLAAHGGKAGLRDEGLLDSALAAPINLFAYEQADIFRLAATYAHALTRNHPFLDGNKRVALTIAGVFLELNGFRLEAPETDAVRATLALSKRELRESDFATWLRDSSSTFRRTGTSRGGRRAAPSRQPRTSR
jgi:death on curing protein